MYIKQDQVKKAVANAKKKCEVFNVQLDPKMIADYEKALKTMAEKHKYQEGAPISEEDLSRINEEARMVLNHMSMVTLTKHRNNPESMKISNPIDYTMLAADYLYALAMQHLGSPDTEPLFGTNFQSAVAGCAHKIYRETVKFDINTDRTYEAQRGKNADELKASGIADRMEAIKNSETTTKEVAQLIADYQALQKRQDDHGAIWRFFHRSENEARTELLKNMETVLKKRLGKDQNLNAINPSDYARKTSDDKYLAHFEYAMEGRSNPEKIYGITEPKKNAEADLSDSRQPLNKKEKANLIADITEKKNDFPKEPIHESAKKVLANENTI